MDSSGSRPERVEGNRRRDIVDKDQSYQSFTQGAVSLYLVLDACELEPGEYGIEILSKKEIQKLVVGTKLKYSNIQTRWAPW